MYFSVGILYSAQDFLLFLKENPRLVSNFVDVFKNLNSVASTKAVLEVCQECHWIELDTDGYLKVTDKGEQVLDSKERVEIALRLQIHHLIEAYRPTWIPLLTRGRSEALKYLPIDVVQCLREAELVASYSDDVIVWWDRVAKISRKTSKEEKLDLSRAGEKLSIEYERNRTNKEPKWQGFESNFSGYDILSVVSSTDNSLLRVEVKISNSNWSVASFHVSRNEWKVAQYSNNYLFYLWILIPNPRLFIVNVNEVGKNIPTNKGNGEWESTEIPFVAICKEDEFVFNTKL